ncbi:MAG: hypothetical protein KJ737_08345 [Proteobacteria bacterium]|nr:hypothetical protein [Pseudomonadota bacterium]
MKHYLFGVVVIVFMLGGISFASQYQIGFKASHEAVGAEFNYIRESGYGSLSTGVNILFNDDEYTILKGNFMLSGDPFLPGLRYGVGFEPIIGKIENRKGSRDGDLLAFGFLFQMAYDLYSSQWKVPVDVIMDLCFAPDPLTSNESTLYTGVKACVEYRILINASISCEYRYTRADFEYSGRDWELSDHIYLLGYTMRF